MKKEIKQGSTLDSLKQITEEIKLREIVCSDWIPTIEDIEKEIAPNFNDFAIFVYWILETASFEKFDNGEEIRKRLLDLFLENIEIKDLDEKQFFISYMKDLNVYVDSDIDTSLNREIIECPTLYERLAYLNLQMEHFENKRREALLASIRKEENTEME